MVLCGVVWCGVVWCCVVLCDVVWCCVVLCGVVWCCVVGTSAVCVEHVMSKMSCFYHSQVPNSFARIFEMCLNSFHKQRE